MFTYSKRNTRESLWWSCSYESVWLWLDKVTQKVKVTKYGTVQGCLQQVLCELNISPDRELWSIFRILHRGYGSYNNYIKGITLLAIVLKEKRKDKIKKKRTYQSPFLPLVYVLLMWRNRYGSKRKLTLVEHETVQFPKNTELNKDKNTRHKLIFHIK